MNYWLERTKETKTERQIECFLTELAELMRDWSCGDALNAKRIYKKYPLVRICLRRAMLVVKKKGYIRDTT